MHTPSFQLQFNFETTADGIDKATKLLNFADTLTPDAPTPPRQPAPKPGKAAPAPAPKGKAAPAAAKANSKAKPPAPEPDDILDLNSGDDEDDEETGGLGLGDDDDAQDDGDGFDGTPEEAKEEALAKLRTMLGNGLKTHVKQVQEIMKVAKFHDVPAEQGFEFLAAVKAVEAKIAKN